MVHENILPYDTPPLRKLSPIINSECVKLTIAVIDNQEAKYSSRVLKSQIVMFGKKHPLHHHFTLQAVQQYSKCGGWDHYPNQCSSQFTGICQSRSMGNYRMENHGYVFSSVMEFIPASLRLIIAPTANGVPTRNASNAGEITLRSKRCMSPNI